MLFPKTSVRKVILSGLPMWQKNAGYSLRFCTPVPCQVEVGQQRLIHD